MIPAVQRGVQKSETQKSEVEKKELFLPSDF
jgi:hypothetical protein